METIFLQEKIVSRDLICDILYTFVNKPSICLLRNMHDVSHNFWTMQKNKQANFHVRNVNMVNHFFFIFSELKIIYLLFSKFVIRNIPKFWILILRGLFYLVVSELDRITWLQIWRLVRKLRFIGLDEP